MKKSNVTLNVEYSERISRLFIFRFLWIYIEMWVLMVWAMWMGIITFFHFWYMLILGKRHQGMWNRQVRFLRHMTLWQSYLGNYTDQRPDFISK